MATGAYNIFHKRGDYFTFDFQVLDVDDSTNIETPRDLSAFTGAMQVRGNGKVLLDLDDSFFTLNSSGEVSIIVPAENMEFIAGKWQYDIQLTDGSGNPETILAGRFTLQQDVTA